MMGRKRLPENVRKTGLIVNIKWSTYHKLEEEGQVNEVASRVLENYVENKIKDIDETNILE
jgi:hypothetical protein